MQVSYSRIGCFNHCKQQYKYRYIDKLKLISTYKADNALIVGNTVHLAIEKDIDEAREFYYSQYNIINDNHINEMIKIEIVVPKVKAMLEGITIHSQEFRISNKRFIGIVDLILKNDDGTVDVLDIKYSNNIKNYLDSGQLHIYKYFLEQLGFKVRRLGYIFVPKCSIRQKQTEDLYQFRKRLIDETSKMNVTLLEIKYNPNKVIDFTHNTIDLLECNDYPKNPTKLCSWCDYENYCLKGDDLDILL